MLPPLLATLLQVLSEAEVYAVVSTAPTATPCCPPSCDLRPVLLGQVEALADRSLTPNTQPKLPHFQLTQQKEELFELAFYDIAAKESDPPTPPHTVSSMTVWSNKSCQRCFISG